MLYVYHCETSLTSPRYIRQSFDNDIFLPSLSTLFSSIVVGFDIQQKFNVYYSGARSLETDNPYNTQYDPAGQRLQNSALKRQSTDQAVPQKENIPFATDQGTTL